MNEFSSNFSGKQTFLDKNTQFPANKIEKPMNFYLAQGMLHPTAPYDFYKSLLFLKIFTPVKNEQLLFGNALMKAVSVNGQAIFMRIESIGTVNQPELTYRLISEQPIPEAVKFAALDRASFFLSLYDNLRPFYHIGGNDNHFTPVLKKLYGFHPVKFLTPFETACWSILIRQNSLPRARKMKEDLIREYGSSINVNGKKLWAFPEPVQLAHVNRENLAKLIENEQKAGYLHAASRAFRDVDEEFLRAGPYQQVKGWLLELEGIDQRAATFVLLKGLGRMEEEPIIDRRLIHAAHRFYGLLSDASISSIAEQYGRWQGYWSHYLRIAA